MRYLSSFGGDLEDNQVSQFTGTRWGVWSTLGFSLIITTLYIIVQVILVALIFVIRLSDNPDIDVQALANSLETNGLFLSLSLISTFLICGGLIILFVAIRKGITVKRYLDFTPLPLKAFIPWLGVIIVFAIVCDGLSLMLGRPIVPDFMVNAYKSAEIYPLFWFSIVIAAPFLEELFFRGFLFEGLRGSRLGSIGAVTITSVIWAGIHLQYGMFEIGLILLVGLALGVAKIKTQSLYIPITMHSFLNLLATIEVALL